MAIRSKRQLMVCYGHLVYSHLLNWQGKEEITLKKWGGFVAITIDDLGDFTYTIFDLIKQMTAVDNFVIKIWTANSELAYLYDDSADFHFMQESIRVTGGDKVTYITLDTIVSIVLYKNKRIGEVW